MTGWLTVERGQAPLIVSFPHTGTDIPADVEARLISPWLARKDADWWVDRLYDFAGELGATLVRTAISRTVIDVNRDPSGASLYPGLVTTTELCPTTTFDGEPLYREGAEPGEAEIADRRTHFFDPYHQTLQEEIERLKQTHGAVVLYDAHSIRSLIPRQFEGLLPHFNIGSNDGATCAPALTAAIEAVCRETTFSWVTNGRYKGGWTVRRYGRPDENVHAVQMELACRGYMDDPAHAPAPSTWPPGYDEVRAAPMRAALRQILKTCRQFAERA